MTHHVLRDNHIMIHLPIMDLELEPDEIRQDGCRTRLRLDRNNLLAHDGPYYRKTGVQGG